MEHAFCRGGGVGDGGEEGGAFGPVGGEFG
jgi:hypothetical protein